MSLKYSNCSILPWDPWQEQVLNLCWKSLLAIEYEVAYLAYMERFSHLNVISPSVDDHVIIFLHQSKDGRVTLYPHSRKQMVIKFFNLKKYENYESYPAPIIREWIIAFRLQYMFSIKWSKILSKIPLIFSPNFCTDSKFVSKTEVKFVSIQTIYGYA